MKGDKMKYTLSKKGQIGTGCHKIHTVECKWRPSDRNAIDLKECMCPIEAMNKAKKYYSNINGCKYCCKEIYYKIEIKM